MDDKQGFPYFGKPSSGLSKIYQDVPSGKLTRIATAVLKMAIVK